MKTKINLFLLTTALFCLFSCEKKVTTATNATADSFVGTWVGAVNLTLSNGDKQSSGLDTITLVKSTTNNNQLINTNLNNTVYTVNNGQYSLPTITEMAVVNFINFTLTRSNSVGTLTNTTTITENGNFTITSPGVQGLSGTYQVVYFKQK